jgi:gas vesicle protein GvpL/GvpF
MRRLSAAKPETATYLYCVAQRDTAPRLSRAPRGLPDTSAPRTLAVGDDLWLVVGDAPLARYGAEPLARGLRDLQWVSSCALAHEAVVEHVARTATTVPLKLFTLFASDTRAVSHVAGLQPRLGRLVERLAGRQEWGVRVTLHEARARRAQAERSIGAATGATSGTKFLLLKKQQREAAREAVERGRKEIDQVFDTLAALADDARRRPPDTVEGAARVLLDAAFLVADRKLPRLKTAARRAATRLGEYHLALTLSGPWPPYNFVGPLA